MFTDNNGTLTWSIAYDWDREKAKKKYDEYVINGWMSTADFFKKIDENWLKVEWLEEAKKKVAVDNLAQEENTQQNNKQKERYVQQLPQEYKGSLIDNIYQSAQNYGWFGKSFVHWAADMFWWLVWGMEQVWWAINDIESKWDKVNKDILKNDFTEAKFKEIYWRLPEDNEHDTKALDDIYSVVDNDKDYKDLVSQKVKEQQTINDKSYWENALDIAEWATTVAFDALEAPAMYAIHTLQNTQVWEPVLNAISTVFQKWWSLIDKIPGLKQWKDSLPEEKKKEFDTWVGMMATLWLGKAVQKGMKIKNWPTDVEWQAVEILDDIWAEWIIDMYNKWFKPEYTDKQIAKADKILQPDKSARVYWDADAAAKGLLENASDTNFKSFEDIKETANTKKQEAYKKLQEWLREANKTYEKTPWEEVYQAALDWLLEAFWDEKRLAPDLKAQRTKIADLLRKNDREWLDLMEKQEVKQLHTKYNNLFTQAGKESAWFSPENLRAIRNVMKTDIEQGALENGYADVVWDNTTYNNNRALEKVIDNQRDRLRNEEARLKDLNLIEKAAKLITNIPWINQLVTKPLWLVIEALKGKSPKNTISDVAWNIKKMVKKMKPWKNNIEQVNAVKKIFGNKKVLESIKKIVEDNKTRENKLTAEQILEMIKKDVAKDKELTKQMKILEEKKQEVEDTTTKKVKEPVEVKKASRKAKQEPKSKELEKWLVDKAKVIEEKKTISNKAKEAKDVNSFIKAISEDDLLYNEINKLEIKKPLKEDYKTFKEYAIALTKWNRNKDLWWHAKAKQIREQVHKK